MDNKPTIQIGCVSNIYIRMMHFHHKGDIEHTHSHQFDHVSFLSKGKVSIEVDGIKKDFEYPHMIMIAKNKEHEITALEDDTILCCIHALREIESEDIINPDQIPYGVDPRALPHKPIS